MEDQLKHIIAKKAELEQFVEEFGDTVSEKLKGKLSRMTHVYF